MSVTEIYSAEPISNDENEFNLEQTSNPPFESNDFMIQILRDKFVTNEEQELFMMSFQMFLRPENKGKFIIDLDETYSWIGYSTKGNAATKLTSTFTEDVDYKLAFAIAKASYGGHNKKQILMTTECFKAFCLIAQTDKGKQIRTYFLKMEEIIEKVKQAETRFLYK